MWALAPEGRFFGIFDFHHRLVGAPEMAAKILKGIGNVFDRALRAAIFFWDLAAASFIFRCLQFPGGSSRNRKKGTFAARLKSCPFKISPDAAMSSGRFATF